jgi:hypothetical protein
VGYVIAHGVWGEGQRLLVVTAEIHTTF